MSRDALGFGATQARLTEKQRHPALYNAGLIARQLDDLERGVGRTYFDIILNIIAAHPAVS